MLAIFSGSCKTLREKENAGDEEPGLRACNAPFVVFGETAIAAEPGKGAFDDPALGFGLEVSDPLGSADDLDPPPAEPCGSLAKLTAAVHPIGEDVAQLREGGTQRAQQRYRTMNILDVGGVYPKRKQEALGISDDVALASFEPFGGIKAARTATFSGFHALTVDHAG